MMFILNAMHFKRLIVYRAILVIVRFYFRSTGVLFKKLNTIYNFMTQAEGEVQSLTKRVRQLEEDFEQTESRLQAASEKLDQASKAADESERLVESNQSVPKLRAGNAEGSFG